jgi:ABC transport system ATP-binding/permease protein
MNYLSVENLKKSFGQKELFKNLSFGINKGEKFAIIAKNGTGKTSLLNILCGRDTPDEGNVVFRKEISVGYLHQDMNFEEYKTIEEVLYNAKNPKIQALKKYKHCMDNGIEGDELNEALMEMEQFAGWDVETDIYQMMSVFGLKEDRHIDTLSGGQKKRLGLCNLLLEEPDLLILDEPTNHLDIQMIEWLEEYLSKEKITLLLVTHDRAFLDNVCNNIIELENKTLYKYAGNYSYYLERKAEREELESVEAGKNKQLFKKELEWARRMPKARGTKSKSRLSDFEELKGKLKKTREKEMEGLKINMQRLGNKIIECRAVNKSFGDLKILENFEYTFKTGEKIAVTGKNGTGKSTFLKMLTGEEFPDSGTIKVGDTVIFGHYKQDGLQVPEDKRVIEVISSIAEYIPLEKGRTMSAKQLLEKFLFPASMHYNQVGTLSGGERKRLLLLMLLMKNPNFLILDEPTNDLDIMTINVLEDFLESYQGCLLVVSHDRYFMDKLTEHTFVFEGDGGVKDFPGTYTQYLFQKETEALENAAKKADNKSQNKVVEKVVEQKVLDTKKLNKIEKEIEKLEEKKKLIESELSSESKSTDEIQKLSKQYEEVEYELSIKMEEWESFI